MPTLLGVFVVGSTKICQKKTGGDGNKCRGQIRKVGPGNFSQFPQFPHLMRVYKVRDMTMMDI